MRRIVLSDDQLPLPEPKNIARSKRARRQDASEQRRRDDALKAAKPDARFLIQLLAGQMSAPGSSETKTAPGSGAAAYHSTMSSEPRIFGPADHLDRAT